MTERAGPGLPLMVTVLQVEHLSKEYRLGVLGHGALYRDLQSWWARWRERDDPNAPIHGQGGSRAIRGDRLWALRDLSLTVGQGEVLGIIGRNGAGKSTLLKIISRVTAPTQGCVKIRGQVASLLEVGTGFHFELTGRENVFLNGAILGMTVPEIRRKFDEIVAFAGVEDFIDTPVKRYSSGMFVRLAFAVAAHLEPDILVVDEVLAVGDVGFQKKCLGKMGQVASQGRTILFVSHNLQAIRKLCPRTLLLEEGRAVADGPTDTTLAAYRQTLHDGKIDADLEIHNREYRRGSGFVRFTGLDLTDQNGAATANFAPGETVRLRCSYASVQEVEGLVIMVGLRSGSSHEMITSVRHVVTTRKIAAGSSGTIGVEFPSLPLRPGEYPVYCRISDVGGLHHYDVVDGLTPPIIIWDDQDSTGLDFDLYGSTGYFTLPSRLVSEGGGT